MPKVWSVNLWWYRLIVPTLTPHLRAQHHPHMETCCKIISRYSQDFLKIRTCQDCAKMLVSWRRSRRASSTSQLRKDLRLCRQDVENALNLKIFRHLDQEDGFVQIQRSVQSWTWNTILTRDVTVLISWSNHCLETKQFHGFALWMASTRTSQKRQKKYPLRTLICSSAQGDSLQKAEPRPKPVVNSSSNYVPINERRWIDIDTQPFDHSCFEVSKFMTRTLRHNASIPREIDGAVKFDDLIEKLKVKFADTLQWTVSTWVNSTWIRSGKTQNRTVQTHLEISSQYSILVQFKACSEKGIATLSNSIACNYSIRHTTSDLYR